MKENREGNQRAGRMAELRKTIATATEELRVIRVKEADLRRRRRIANDRVRLRQTLKRFGGKDEFVRKHGCGSVVVEPGGGCAHVHGWKAFSFECSLLGVKPNFHVIHCRFSGRHDYEGKKVCGIHLNMLRGNNYRLCAVEELVDRWKEDWA